MAALRRGMPLMTPRSLPWRALIHFTIAALATYAFVVLAEAVLEGRADATDRAVALWVHHHVDTPVLDQVMIGITTLGSGTMLVVAIVATSIWLWRNGHRRTTLILVGNAVAAAVINYVLKLYVARPRPTLFDEITRPETFSFPSGHSLFAMTIYGGIAAAIVTHHPWRRPWVIGGAALLVVAIGFSRVYLGVHWPFDVLAGFAAGLPLLMSTVHLLHTRAKTTRLDDQMNIYSPA